MSVFVVAQLVVGVFVAWLVVCVFVVSWLVVGVFVIGVLTVGGCLERPGLGGFVVRDICPDQLSKNYCPRCSCQCPGVSTL